MEKAKSLALIIVLAFCLTVNAQKGCNFKIDTIAILHNSNINSFLSALKNDSFYVTNNKKDIPNFIKSQLNCMSNGFTIVNPERSFQETDIVSWRLKKKPLRQLTFLARSKNIFVLTYKKGGFGMSNHIVLVKFENKKIVDLWSANLSRDLTTIEEIILGLNDKDFFKPNTADF